MGHENAGGWQPWVVSFAENPAVQTDGSLLFAAPQFGFISQDGFLRYMSFPVDDPDYDWRSFNFDRDHKKMSSMARILSVKTNLARFRQKGGKIIMYHGLSDTVLSPFQTVDYFLKVRRAMGGEERTDEFLRFFKVPGMLHCGGGPGPNMFDSFGALEDWVEQDIAPDYMIASGGTLNYTRPLCPYPQVAVYDESCGEMDSADCFTCQEP